MRETCISQLEATWALIANNMVKIENLASRLVGSNNSSTKKERKQRAKRELTPEEKVSFHAYMVAGRLAKEKSRY